MLYFYYEGEEEYMCIVLGNRKKRKDWIFLLWKKKNVKALRDGEEESRLFCNCILVIWVKFEGLGYFFLGGLL